MPVSRYTRVIRASFLSLVGVVFTIAVLVYAVSPRRDPAFVPTSSNAGSRVAWAASIPEVVWTQGIALIALVLAINMVLLLRSTRTPGLPAQHRRPGILRQLAGGLAAVLLCLGFAYVLRFGMLWYLLVQSIVD